MLDGRHCTIVGTRWQTTLTMVRFAAIVGGMQGEPIVRAFDGSLADAEGLLSVEKVTFKESPYTTTQVQAMLSSGTQRAWLALAGDQVIGFVVAFSTHGLRGPRWEIDLLAVHPDWTRRGLATCLLEAAATHGATVAGKARAVVSTENYGSGRAFARAGFRRSERCELLIFRPQDGAPRPWHALGVTIREARGRQDLESCLQQGFSPPGAGVQSSTLERCGWTLLVAESHDRIAGCAELSEVQTLLYHGVWIESLAASRQVVRIALAHEALNHAAAAGLDEIGMMVPAGDYSLRVALKESGFRSLGQFDWYETELPMPGQPLPQARHERPGGDSV
jgi:ribosomal protein S18 acetylase RimI-like enzyme